jgi:hypothetical protein
VRLAEKHCADVVGVGDHHAAYTSDEAGKLAKALEVNADQRGDGSTDEVVE